LSIERARSLVHGIAHLPVMPAHADDLLRVATSGDAEPASLLAIVERDAVLSAMVLRLVNSASYGLPREISELRHAVVLLGVSELRTLALAASMSSLFDAGDSDHETGWDHAFATACAARALAEELAPGHEEAVFAAGMLHDIGELVIATLAPHARVTGRTNLVAEEAAFGANHAEFGAALAEHWSIPSHLVDAIANHHSPAMTDARADLATLVFAGEAVCDTFMPSSGAAGSGIDAFLMLESLGAARPEAMALRIREAVLSHVNATHLAGKGA
jgi:putative nucleotidyltransferase with HDIG domain